MSIDKPFKDATNQSDIYKMAIRFLEGEYNMRQIGVMSETGELAVKIIGTCQIIADKNGVVNLSTPADVEAIQTISTAVQRALIFVAGISEANISSRWSHSDVEADNIILGRILKGQDPFKARDIMDVFEKTPIINPNQVLYSIDRKTLEARIQENCGLYGNQILQKLWTVSNTAMDSNHTLPAGTIDLVLP